MSDIQSLLQYPLEEVTFSLVDVETTGLNPHRDAICEIGIAKLRGGVIISQLSTLVNPQRPMPPEAEKVHHLSDEMLSKAPPLVEIFPLFLRFIEGTIIVGHNVGFDLSFLIPQAKNFGFDFSATPILDTLQLARKFMSNRLNGFSLEKIAEQLKIPSAQHHRALNDAETTAQFLNIILKELKNRGIKTLRELFSRHPDLDISSQIRDKNKLQEFLWFAIQHSIPIEIKYRNGRGTVTNRIVRPLKLIHPYLHAFCETKAEKRTFRLDRIEDYQLLKDKNPLLFPDEE